MIVQELIDELLKLPSHMRVVVYDNEHQDNWLAHSVVTKEVFGERIDASRDVHGNEHRAERAPFRETVVFITEDESPVQKT